MESIVCIHKALGQDFQFSRRDLLVGVASKLMMNDLGKILMALLRDGPCSSSNHLDAAMRHLYPLWLSLNILL